MLWVCIKYPMCDLTCDVTSYCVWSCDMGKINVYDKIMIENQKKEKIWKSKNFGINLHQIDGLGMEFTAC